MGNNLKTGQVLYLSSCHKRIVSKVVRTFFTVEGNKRSRYLVDSLKEERTSVQLYLTSKEPEEIQERYMLEDEIRTRIMPYGNTGIPLENLRKIREILK
ncbi:beta barrel domain-containing protein [Chitinophaga nivalis]